MARRLHRSTRPTRRNVVLMSHASGTDQYTLFDLPDNVEIRRCRKCGIIKTIDNFGLNIHRKNGVPSRRLICKPCYIPHRRAIDRRYKTNPDNQQKAQRSQRKRYYGRGFDYDTTLAAQNGVCALCKMPPENDELLYVDHDHDCCPGKKSCGECVRGLIHNRCNLGLGAFKDDIQNLLNAINYLARKQIVGRIDD